MKQNFLEELARQVVVQQPEVDVMEAIECALESSITTMESIIGVETAVIRNYNRIFNSGSEVTMESLAEYERSTQLILTAAGIDVPATILSVSFEADEKASKEKAEANKENFVKRTAKAFLETIKKFFEWLKSWFTKKKQETGKLKEEVAEIKQTAKEIKQETNDGANVAESTPAKEKEPKAPAKPEPQVKKPEPTPTAKAEVKKPEPTPTAKAEVKKTEPKTKKVHGFVGHLPPTHQVNSAINWLSDGIFNLKLAYYIRNKRFGAEEAKDTVEGCLETLEDFRKFAKSAKVDLKSRLFSKPSEVVAYAEGMEKLIAFTEQEFRRAEEYIKDLEKIIENSYSGLDAVDPEVSRHLIKLLSTQRTLLTEVNTTVMWIFDANKKVLKEANDELFGR